MSFFGFLYGLDDGLVDPEADGDGQERQDEVRDDADDAEGGQREQQDQGGAEDDARLLHVPPEDQVAHYRRKETKGGP